MYIFLLVSLLFIYEMTKPVKCPHCGKAYMKQVEGWNKLECRNCKYIDYN